MVFYEYDKNSKAFKCAGTIEKRKVKELHHAKKLIVVEKSPRIRFSGLKCTKSLFFCQRTKITFKEFLLSFLWPCFFFHYFKLHDSKLVRSKFGFRLLLDVFGTFWLKNLVVQTNIRTQTAERGFVWKHLNNVSQSPFKFDMKWFCETLFIRYKLPVNRSSPTELFWWFHNRFSRGWIVCIRGFKLIAAEKL